MMTIEIIADRRPTMALSGSTGNPVMPASVVTGMPIDPNATDAVLAISGSSRMTVAPRQRPLADTTSASAAVPPRFGSMSVPVWATNAYDMQRKSVRCMGSSTGGRNAH